MAGIQLIDTDLNESNLDLSGAMPTATVEEINVPVFIDEYLQQQEILTATSTGTTTTTAAAAATATAYSNQYNNNNNDNEICIEDGTLEAFEFDFDMLAESIAHQQQPQLSHHISSSSVRSDSDNCNMNFNMNMNSNSDDGLMNIEFLLTDEPTIRSEDFDDFPDDFRDSNCINDDEFAGYGDCSTIGLSCEDSINISQMENVDLLSCALNNSQHNPWLSFSNNNSQTVVTDAEPILAYSTEEFAPYATPSESQSLEPCNLTEVVFDALSADDFAETVRRNLKRSGSPMPTVCEPMAKRRPELRLEIHNNGIAKDVMNTPDVVKFIAEEEQKLPKQEMKSEDEILNDLMDCSNASYVSITEQLYSEVAKIEANSRDPFNDDEYPATPQSYASSHTNQTGFTGFASSPNSPAPSSTSAQNTSRKRRGRPSKTHSDRPNPEQLQNLSESERKKVEDRAKNNEASRLSRLKNKQREDEERNKAEALQRRNNQLTQQMDELTRIELKFRRELEKYHFPQR